MRVALTGATGFIGAAALAELAGRGVPVAAVVRPGSDRARLAGLSGHRLFEAAHLDEPAIAVALRDFQPTHLIQCAWRGVAGADRNEAFQITENLPLTIASVELARASGCRHWLGLGSQAEYGHPNRIVTEDAPTRPTTLYGRAKLAACLAATGLCQVHGLGAAWLRLFSTYGPLNDPAWFLQETIGQFLAGHRPRLTRCEQRWDFLHVADVARAIARTAECGATGVFNLGSGTAVVLREIVEMIRRACGATVEADYGAIPHRPDHVMHLQADIQRLVAATGWRPQISLEAGLSAAVEFYRNHSSAR